MGFVLMPMRCVVCGVGNRLRGDDAFGPVVVDALRREVGESGDLLFLDCGSAPENFLSKVDEFKPRRVIVVDAVDSGKASGAVEVVDTGRIRGFLHSTHQLPLSLFIDYLESNVGCEVVFVGAQPKEVGFGSEMSDECRNAVFVGVETVRGKIC